jgi:hypothetical protein
MAKQKPVVVLKNGVGKLIARAKKLFVENKALKTEQEKTIDAIEEMIETVDKAFAEIDGKK